MSKCIFTTLSPNADRHIRWSSFLWLFRPWSWKVGRYIHDLESSFREYFSTHDAVSFDSGRSALLAGMKALGIGPGDEVIVPGLTCIVVPNAVIFAGATPVYCDVDVMTYNIDTRLLASCITPKTKAILVQHTFGKPCEMEEIISIAKQNNLFVIEDCAHSLGSRYRRKLLGTFGDIAIFSFGRDKVISSVHGGIVIAKDPEIASKIRQIQDHLSYPGFIRIKQSLLHPIVFAFVLPLYRSVGKFVLFVSQKLHLLSKALEPCEKKSVRPQHHPLKLPNALAAISLDQFRDIGSNVTYRLEIAKYYNQHISGTEISRPTFDSEQTYLMYTIRTKHAKEIIKSAKNLCIELGNWTGANILPADSDLKNAYYKIGSCPNAELIADELINLPTHKNISQKDAQRIVNLLNV